MASNRFLALSLVLLFCAVPGVQAFTFDEAADYPWMPDRAHVLTWSMAECDGALAEDVLLAGNRMNAALEKARVHLRFHYVGFHENVTTLREFGDEGTGGLLVASVVQEAQSDVLVGCIEQDVYARATDNQTDALSHTRSVYTVRNTTLGETALYRGAVILIPEGQAIPTPGCHDPRPVGHELRQTSVMRAFLRAAGLGAPDGSPGDLYGPLDEAFNHSCSAWFNPPSRTIGAQTQNRLQALWGVDPGPPFSARVAASMRDNAVYWVLTPAIFVLAAGIFAFVAMRKQREAPPPVSGIVRRTDKGWAAPVERTAFSANDAPAQQGAYGGYQEKSDDEL